MRLGIGKRGCVTAAVVVTWNRKELLRQNLACLLGQEGATCDILVVDNDSTDGTAEMLASEFDDPRLRYFNTGANLGGAGGFHVGIYWAATDGYENIWIMDDDCLPSPTALSELLGAGERLGGDWGFLCSAIYWTDGEICKFNRPKKDVFRHVGPEDYERDLVPVVMTSFVSVMFRAEAVLELGLPIPEYFIWTDDYEYTGRISKSYPCYAVPSSRVTHAMKSNARPSLATEDVGRIGRFYYLSRNDMHCYRQHGLMGRAYLGAKAAYTAADVMLHAESGRAARIGKLLKGTRDGLSFKPRPVLFGDIISSDSNTLSTSPDGVSVRNKVISSISRIKQFQLFRTLLVPVGQLGFVYGDLWYRRSLDSQYIASLRDTHHGERCFIVGNGPSLNMKDLNSIVNEFSFAANRIYNVFAKTYWRPSVYIAIDRDLLASEASLLAELDVPAMFIRRTIATRGLKKRAATCTYINARAKKFTRKRFSNSKVDFSERPDRVIYDGFTVTYVALQLAIWMGFTDIYLIGMDHVFTHEVTPDGVIHENVGVKNHCYNDPSGAVINPQPRQGVEYAYSLARQKAERQGVHIYNATRGGALESFERIDLDELLS